MPLLIPPVYQCPSHPLFPHKDYPSTPVGDSGFFQHQIPTVSPEELTLPRSARCALSRLRCNGHKTLHNSYLHRIGRAETHSCSNCGSESQDLSHLVLDCPVLDPLRRAIFGHTLSLLDLWSRPWGVARLLGFRGVDPPPIVRNGSGKSTTTTTKAWLQTSPKLQNDSSATTANNHFNNFVLTSYKNKLAPRWLIKLNISSTTQA